MNKAIPFFMSAVLLVSNLTYLPVHAEGEESEDTASYSGLRILFTNDLHDRLSASRISMEDGSAAMRGGYAALKGVINEERTEGTVLVDAGNFSTGSAYDCLYATTGASLSLMASMGYDAVGIGMHDLTYGVPSFTDMIAATSSAPTLIRSSVTVDEGTVGKNLDTTFDSRHAEETKIIETAGHKVGIFSVIAETGIAEEISGLSINDYLDTAKQSVEQLQEDGADYIIALCSETDPAEKSTPGEGASTLANKVDGINLIVTSGTHNALAKPEQVDDTQIVSAGAYGQYLGVADIGDDGSLKDYRLVEVNSDSPSDEGIRNSVEEYRNTVQSKLLSGTKYELSDTIAANNINMTPVSDVYHDFTGNNTADLITDAYAAAYADWYSDWYETWRENKSTRLQAAKNAAEAKRQAEALENGETGEESAEGEEAAPTPTPTADPIVTKIQNMEPDVRESAIGITSKKLIADTFRKDGITVEDIINATSSGVDTNGMELVLVFMKGEDLRQLCEFDATLARESYPSEQLFFSGLQYDYSDYRSDWNHVEDVYADEINGYYVPVKDEILYPVITNIEFVSHLDRISELSHAKLTVNIYNEKGRKISDPSECILKDEDGREIREYNALLDCIRNLERNSDGKAEVPSSYAVARHMKKLDKKFDLIRFFKNTSDTAMKNYMQWVFGIVAALIAVRIAGILVRRRTGRK